MEFHYEQHHVVGWICVCYTNFYHMKMDFHCFVSLSDMLLNKTMKVHFDVFRR